MKITKGYLKELIKEELSEISQETGDSEGESIVPITSTVVSLQNELDALETSLGTVKGLVEKLIKEKK
jgi:hypothetical protein